MYDAQQRAHRHARADLIEDLLAGRAETKEGARATTARIKTLRKG